MGKWTLLSSTGEKLELSYLVCTDKALSYLVHEFPNLIKLSLGKQNRTGQSALTKCEDSSTILHPYSRWISSFIYKTRIHLAW
jgi:hypothetical protein